MYENNEINQSKKDSLEDEEIFDDIIEDSTINEQSVIFNANILEKGRKLLRCVCKIKTNIENKISFGTGFFCYIPPKQMMVLITNNHVIDDKYLKDNKNITFFREINGEQEERVIYLQSDRFTYTDKNLDVTIIEIIDEDFIEDCFEIDENYIKNKEFKGKSVFNLQFPKGESLQLSFGKILFTNSEKIRFVYDAGTEAGSSGSPIFTEGLKVIGIHKGTSKFIYRNKKINIGLYMDNIIKILPNQKQRNPNIIKCIYSIKKEDINKDIKIYDNENNIENYIKSYTIYREDEKKKRPIDGVYKFPKEGKYYIIYDFKDSVKDLSNMFLDCVCLEKVFIHSFPNNKIETMSDMFHGCFSLEEIHFFSFETKNVKTMSNMFYICHSLEQINLSSFNTENVTNMSEMFSGCSSLTDINVSSFNTEKVKNLSRMFKDCYKLREIDISSFNTENVTNMLGMFQQCKKIREINFPNLFNAKNASDLSFMFEGCKSLEKLDLSKFTINYETKMEGMFRNCRNLNEIIFPTLKANNNNISIQIEEIFLNCSSLKVIKNCNEKNIIEEFEKSNPINKKKMN